MGRASTSGVDRLRCWRRQTCGVGDHLCTRVDCHADKPEGRPVLRGDASAVPSGGRASGSWGLVLAGTHNLEAIAWYGALIWGQTWPGKCLRVRGCASGWNWCLAWRLWGSGYGWRSTGSSGRGSSELLAQLGDDRRGDARDGEEFGVGGGLDAGKAAKPKHQCLLSLWSDPIDTV